LGVRLQPHDATTAEAGPPGSPVNGATDQVRPEYPPSTAGLLPLRGQTPETGLKRPTFTHHVHPPSCSLASPGRPRCRPGASPAAAARPSASVPGSGTTVNR